VPSADQSWRRAVVVLAMAQSFERAIKFLDRFCKGEALSEGQQGRVYKVSERGTRRPFVVKRPFNEADLNDYLNAKDKQHPNIVRVYDAFQDGGMTHIVMEFCEGGDLFSTFRKFQNPTEAWVAGVMRQVLLGAQYIHEVCREAHNDIKPENILLDHAPQWAGDVPCAKLGDLGGVSDRYMPNQHVVGGDPRYRAPETWNHESAPMSARTDMWSIGVTLYELLSGGLLIWVYEQNVKGWQAFTEHNGGQLCNRFTSIAMAWPPYPVDLSHIRTGPAARDVLQWLLSLDPARRPGAQQTLQHHFFTQQNAQSGRSIPADCGMPFGKPPALPPLGLFQQPMPGVVPGAPSASVVPALLWAAPPAPAPAPGVLGQNPRALTFALNPPEQPVARVAGVRSFVATPQARHLGGAPKAMSFVPQMQQPSVAVAPMMVTPSVVHPVQSFAPALLDPRMDERLMAMRMAASPQKPQHMPEVTPSFVLPAQSFAPASLDPRMDQRLMAMRMAVAPQMPQHMPEVRPRAHSFDASAARFAFQAAGSAVAREGASARAQSFHCLTPRARPVAPSVPVAGSPPFQPPLQAWSRSVVPSTNSESMSARVRHTAQRPLQMPPPVNWVAPKLQAEALSRPPQMPAPKGSPTPSLQHAMSFDAQAAQAQASRAAPGPIRWNALSRDQNRQADEVHFQWQRQKDVPARSFDRGIQHADCRAPGPSMCSEGFDATIQPMSLMETTSPLVPSWRFDAPRMEVPVWVSAHGG